MNIPLTQEQLDSIQIYEKLEGYEFVTRVYSIESCYVQVIFKSNDNGKLYSFTYYQDRKSHKNNFYNVPELVEVTRRRIQVPASTIEVFTPA